jgi:hypothetical protein
MHNNNNARILTNQRVLGEKSAKRQNFRYAVPSLQRTRTEGGNKPKPMLAAIITETII